MAYSRSIENIPIKLSIQQNDGDFAAFRIAEKNPWVLQYPLYSSYEARDYKENET